MPKHSSPTAGDFTAAAAAPSNIVIFPYPAYVLFPPKRVILPYDEVFVLFPAGYGGALGVGLGVANSKAVTGGNVVLEVHEELEGSVAFDTISTVACETTHSPFPLSQNGASLGLQPGQLHSSTAEMAGTYQHPFASPDAPLHAVLS